MKHFSILLLALAASVGTTLASTKIGDLYYDLDDENQTAEVTNNGNPSSAYSGLTTVTIPSTVEYNDVTYSVTSIGREAFWNCPGLTSVAIGDNVTSIGTSAFTYCSGLTSIEIPNSVTSIRPFAFAACTGLTSVTIPNSVTSIGSAVFNQCTGLTTIVVANENPSYDSRNNCNAIINTSTNMLVAGCKNTIIPYGVSSIGDYAFSSCSGLTSIEIPSSVVNIGECAFEGCSGLTSVTIPNSVTSIGLRAFAVCSGLTSVTNYATTPQTINEGVFSNVNVSECTLYVPKESAAAYAAADVWKDFEHIEGMDKYATINYLDYAGSIFNSETLFLSLLTAPPIEGFTFLRWDIIAGTLSDGINIQAIYTANTPTDAPSVYTNPANPAQKLIRNGNVYILTGDKTYTVTGQEVK